jgi:hypothetical protein
MTDGTPGKGKWIDRTKPWVELAAAIIGIAGVAFLIWQVTILQGQTQSLNAQIAILKEQTELLDNQTQSLNEQLQQTYRNDTFSRSLEFDKLILDRPTEYEAVIAAGKGPEMLREGAANPEQLAKAKALAVYIADFFDYILELYPVRDYPELAPSSNVPQDDTYAGYLAWSNTIRGTFKDESLLCETLIENKENYGAGFTDRLRGRSVCPGL